MKPLLRTIRLKDTGYRFILIFTLLSLGIIIGGVIYFRQYEQQFRSDAENQLAAIAKLKVNDLAGWRHERLADANVFYKNATFSGLVRRFFENPRDRETQKQLRTWLGNFQAAYNYERVILLDHLYSRKMIIPDGPERSTSFVSPSNSEDLRSEKVVFQDFYWNEQNRKIYLKVLVPISDDADGGRVIGILVLRIDPEVYLYPLITRWPVPSSTAETLLIRRDGNDALFLNELRFQTKTALKFRISLDSTEVPAVKAALGKEGTVEGLDYRGVKVIASVLRVPNSPWFMIARMDISEIYAPIKRGGWIVVIVVLLLLFSTGIGMSLVWQQNAKAQYEALLETEIARREVEERYRVTLMSVGDGVIVTEAEGRVVLLNPAAERLTGWRHDEAIGRPLVEVFRIINEKTRRPAAVTGHP